MNKSEKQALTGNLALLTDARSPAAEAYRALLANLRFADPERPPRTILFTSASADEGKSTTVANVGVTAAQAGLRVILIDADVRRPSLHALFGLPNSVGFSNAVHDGSAPHLQETSTVGLQVLTSGPAHSNPGELLASDRVAHLFATLRSDANTVFIDAPPAGIVADAAILAPQVEGVVLVISAFRTRREDAIRAKEQIERVHGTLLGVVLNNARVDAIRYRY